MYLPVLGRIILLETLRTDAVTDICLGMIMDIDFNLLPVP